MLRMVTAQSDALEPMEAVDEALAQCEDKGVSKQPAVGLLYTSFLDISFEQLLAPFSQRFPEMQLIGCTTDGEFSDVAGWSEESLVLSLLCPSDAVSCAVGIGKNLSGNTRQAARDAVAMASHRLKDPAKLCLTIPDGLNSFTSPVAQVLSQELGPGVSVVGGTAGDNFRAVQTYQFHNGATYSNALPVLLFGGDIRFSFSLASGWSPIGPLFEVTETRGPAVVSINGRSALELYKEFLGQDSLSIQELSPFSLAVYHENSDDFYLRAPAGLDEDSGAVIFAGNIEQGAQVRFTEMGRDEIAAAARTSAEQARQAFPGNSPDAVLAFSCTSRRQILGSRTNEEPAHLREIFPGVPFSGFYTYGELCPFGQNSASQFHNGTFVTCCLGQA